MDYEKLIEQYQNAADHWRKNKPDFPDVASSYERAATALATIQAENERLKNKLSELAHLPFDEPGIGERTRLMAENAELRAELEQVKRERDAAVDCIYKIEDALDRGNDNDWAREHISEWESQKED